MNRVLGVVVYLSVVVLGANAVHLTVNNHRFNVALEQLKKECTPFGSEDLTLTYTCNGQLVRVKERMDEMVQDDGSL